MTRLTALHSSVFVFLMVAILYPFAVGAFSILPVFETNTIAIGEIESANGSMSTGTPLSRFPIVIHTNEALLINAIEVELHTDPSVVALSHFEMLPSFCEERFIIEHTVDTEAGRSYYACGTIAPTATTSPTIGYIYLTKVASGTTTLSFGSSTNAYLHDGLGTQIIESAVAKII